MNIWLGIPFNTILLSAGITSLPEDVFEAATVDGATGWQKLRYLTIPMLRSTILAVLMLGFIYTLRVFDVIWIMTKGGPANATEVLPTFAYRLSFISFNFGQSAAVSVIILGILLVAAIAYLNWPYRKRIYESEKKSTLARFTLGAIVTVIYLIPLYWMVTTSLKPVDQIFQKPPVLFPSTLQIDSYKQILGLPTDRAEIYINAVVYLKNSLIIASATMVLTMLMAIPAAYALSRFQFRGRWAFVLFLLVAQMLPSVLMVIPLFVLFRQWGIINLPYISVILADTALALPFAIIILRTSFLQIPTVIEEAAWVDGASRLQVLRYILLPLIRAGLVAVGVFSFLIAWGEFVFALSFIQKTELQPISIGTFQFIGMYKSNFDSMMAFSTIVAIPAVVAFLVVTAPVY